jgi:hypothetical protein
MSWPKFLEALKRRKQMLASLLSMAEVRSVEDNKIHVTFRNSYETNRQVVSKSENKAVIEDALRNFYKTSARIEFELDNSPPPKVKTETRRQSEQIDADDLLDDDPDLKQLLEQIDGEIIGRRKIEE